MRSRRQLSVFEPTPQGRDRMSSGARQHHELARNCGLLLATDGTLTPRRADARQIAVPRAPRGPHRRVSTPPRRCCRLGFEGRIAAPRLHLVAQNIWSSGDPAWNPAQMKKDLLEKRNAAE